MIHPAERLVLQLVLTNKTPEKQVNLLFDRVASNYDQMNDLISLGTQKKWREKTMETLKVKPGMNILDLCCGTGVWTIMLAHAAGMSGSVIGMDFSKEMLKVAERKIRDNQLEKSISLVHGNVMKLNYPDNHFNAVTIGFGLRNVPDANQVLREMLRVVKPGGVIASLETSHPTNRFIECGWKMYLQVMPILAKLKGNKYADYDYLHKTSEKFATPDQLKGMFIAAGAVDVSYRLFNLGAGALHIGYKKS